MNENRNKKELINSLTDIVEETFGYGKKGKHYKKCDICECDFEESNDLDYLVVHGPAKCPNCKNVIELRDCLHEYSNIITNIEISDPLYDKNMIKERTYDYGFGKVENFSLDKFDSEVVLIGRTNKIQDLIKRIDEARKFLYVDLEPKINILKSIYHNKDKFWEYGGNLAFQISKVTVEYVVIKLNEFFSKSKYSIFKIRNILNNDKKAIYDEQKIIIKRTYKTSGDIQEILYDRFNIEKYLSKLDNILSEYKNILEAFKDIRDTQFAHFDEPKIEGSRSKLTYLNLIKIFNTLKVIYDGFLYSVAPDLYKLITVEANVWYSRLNDVVKYYEDNYINNINNLKKNCKK